MSINSKRGFTLIELLVVIAIIGILASVVLASLNTARSKGKDAAIQSSLSSLRAAAEVDYDTNADYRSVCAEAGAATGNSTLTLTAGTEFAKVSAAIDAQKGGSNNTVCNESTNSAAYAAYVTLVATGDRFCVDSTGQAKKVPSATTIAADTTLCP